MKRHLSFFTFVSAVSLIFALTLVAAMIPTLQNFTANRFSLGFPISFLTIHVSHAHGFCTHLNLAGLTADLVLGYFVCALLRKGSS